MQFAHSITCISHCMAQDEPPNVSVCALHSFFTSSMMCAWAFVVCLFVFVLLLFLSVVDLFSSTLYLHSDLHFLSNVNSVEGIDHCAFAQRGVPPGDIPSSLLRDFCSDLPGWIWRHRCGAFVLVRCGTRRWEYRKSAIFTTDSFRSEKNQRTWDKLITLMKKVCCQLSPFSHTHVRGDP